MYIRMYWDGDEGGFITQLNETRDTNWMDSRKGVRSQESGVDGCGGEGGNCRLAGRSGGWLTGLGWIMDMLWDTDTVM